MSESEREHIGSDTNRETESLDTSIALESDDIAALLLVLPDEIRRRLRKAKGKGVPSIRGHVRYAGRGRGIPYVHPEVSDFNIKRTKADLYEEAVRCDIPGRSRMTKSELECAVGAC